MKNGEELSIDFQKKSLKDVLTEHTFRLLSGQREYAWEKQQWEELWQDIEDVVKVIDNNKVPKSYKEHFFGPMFFIPESKNEKEVFILDGQQRLVTLCMILALIRDLSLLKLKLQPNLEDISFSLICDTENILFADMQSKTVRIELGDQTEDAFIKLVNRKDSIISQLRTLKNETKRNKSAHLLINSYEYFLKQIYNYIHQVSSNNLPKNINEDALIKMVNCSEIFSFLRKLYNSIMSYFYTLEITIPAYDLGFEIFETLNQRGSKLEPAELFKNLIFSRLEKEIGKGNVSELWNKIYRPVTQENFGVFLRHYWISKFEHVSNKKLFRSIRMESDKLDNKGFEELLKEMSEEAVIYAALLDPSSDFWENQAEIASLLDELNFLKFRQAFPLLLVLYKKLIPTCYDDFLRFLKLLLNFSVRSYTILGRNPNELEKNIDDATRFIQEKFPSDDEVREKIIGMKVSDKKARYILTKVNDALESTPLHRTWNNQPTLEHVIPKNPNDFWKQYLKSKNMDHDVFVNRLGNLTILSQEENRELGNLPYTEKREKYLNTKLPLNIETFQQFSEFDSDAIKKREEIIATLIIKRKIWSIPQD
jgi:uncharacterized protein with ParB-like and HNH nuclease domain